MIQKRIRKAPEYRAKLWGMFNNPTGDGIKLVAFLLKNELEEVITAPCTFSVYLVNETTWAETLLATSAGTASGKKWILDLSEAALGGQEIIGERTLKVYASMLRGTKTYRMQGYLNHLGIWDTALRTKLRVDFIEIEVL